MGKPPTHPRRNFEEIRRKSVMDDEAPFADRDEEMLGSEVTPAELTTRYGRNRKKGRDKRYTSEQVKQFANKAIRDQKTRKEFAKELGVTYATLTRYLQSAGISVKAFRRTFSPGRPPRQDQEALKIMGRYRGRVTFRDIADELGYSSHTAIHILIERYIVDHVNFEKVFGQIEPRLIPLRKDEVRLVKMLWELKENGELFDNPDQLATLSNLPLSTVMEYLDRVYKFNVLSPKSQEEFLALQLKEGKKFRTIEQEKLNQVNV